MRQLRCECTTRWSHHEVEHLFIINSAIAVGYALAFLVATPPVLAVYGLAPNPDGSFMARWFGVGLLAIGLTTWLARNTAASPAGRAAVRGGTARA